jgi:RNA ligase (TIGR02306 family)
MERKLASIQVIEDLQPIPDADLIEVATVKGWKLVVKKGEYKIGDKAIYCEIDSFLPIKEQYEFLRKSSFKRMGDIEGFRLRTIKLRGQVSQGLLLPIANSIAVKESLEIGQDVSESLGIIKFEPPIPAELSGVMKGSFPNFIPKTDEERIQNLTDVYDNFKKSMFYVTEKLDGSSATY